MTLDIEVSPPEDRAGRLVTKAIALLQAGERVGARDACRRALAADSRQASTWSNLSAFALMSGNVEAAQMRAHRALQHTPDHVDALVNLSAATYGGGAHEQAMSIVRKALDLRPRHAKALANFGSMLIARQEYGAAQEILRRAAAENPGSPRIAMECALASYSSNSGDTTRPLALAALDLLTGALPGVLRIAPRKPQMLVGDARLALCEAQDALVRAGQPFYLIAGTLLGLVRDGDLLAHDKDIDLALPYDSDREQVAAVFERHPNFRVPPRPQVPAAQPLWAFGVIHVPTGTTIDLFFAKQESDGVRFGFAVPPHQIFCTLRHFEIGVLQWQGRQWPIPVPAEQYLEDIYGLDWRTPDPYFDTVLSNPCRARESLPRAVDLGLLRLGGSLLECDWLRAHSLCRQLLAREPLAAVSALQALLSTRCAVLSA